MAKNLDKKMLNGFVQEVRGYLPQIRANLATLGTNFKRGELLEETYRFVHTIKGASAMVGLAVLSHITYYVEGTFEELMAGQLQLDQDLSAWILRTLDHIESYLAGLLSGAVPEQTIVTDVVQSFRRLKGLPESGDAAAIEEVLAGNEAPVRTQPVVAAALSEPQDTTALFQDTPSQATTDATADDFSLEDSADQHTLDVDALERVFPDIGKNRTSATSRPPQTNRPATPPPGETLQLVDTDGALEALIASIDQEVTQTYSPPVLTPMPVAPTPPRSTASGDIANRYVLFDLAGARYAVSVASVFEVGRVPAVTPIPNVPSWIRGVINMRGEILSVIDFRTFLGIVETYPRDSSRMLIVKSAGEEVTTSLIVDRVVGIVQLPQVQLEPPPAPDSDRVAPYLTGVCQHQEHLLAVLNLEDFLLSPEVCQFS